MAHKKGVGSSRNGRDSNPQMLGVKRFGGQFVTGGSHPGPAARHPLQARQQRRPGLGRHAVREGRRRTCKFERTRRLALHQHPDAAAGLIRGRVPAGARRAPCGGDSDVRRRDRHLRQGRRRRRRLRELPAREVRAPRRPRWRRRGRRRLACFSRPIPRSPRCSTSTTSATTTPSAACTARAATATAPAARISSCGCRSAPWSRDRDTRRAARRSHHAGPAAAGRPRRARRARQRALLHLHQPGSAPRRPRPAGRPSAGSTSS